MSEDHENEGKNEPENAVREQNSSSVRAEDILRILRAVRRESWDETRKRIFTERRFICAMDRAAECPDWWHVNRLHFYNPEMTHAHIARLLGLKRETVTRWIRDVEIPEDDYEKLPL